VDAETATISSNQTAGTAATLVLIGVLLTNSADIENWFSYSSIFHFLLGSLIYYINKCL
jgi:hypothetical protein